MTQKILLTLCALIGVALVVMGNEWISRGISATGHLMIIASLIMGIWMNSKKDDNKPLKSMGSDEVSKPSKTLKSMKR